MSDTQKINLKDMIRTEYVKCATDEAYFMQKYAMIQHAQKGRFLFNLYPYQKDALETFKQKKYTIVLKGRQIGFSTLVSMHTLWLMLFHRDKNIVIIATKQETAKNIVTKIRFAFDNLPVWLQVPVTENNKLSMRLKNGSQVKALSASEDSARSEAASLLIIDEAAHIKNANEIWTSAQATLSTGGRAIIISTPNGIGGFFHKKYVEAEEFVGRDPGGEVMFPLKLDWRNDPNRSPEWRALQDTIMDPRKARQEYDADFLGSGNTVIDGDLIEFYNKTYRADPILKKGPGGDVFVWELPNYTRSYIVCADVGRGENSDSGDYSAFHVIDVETCTQVAEYKGRLSTTDFGHLLIAIATEYNDALLIIENANVGWATIQTVIERGYKNLFYMTEDLKYLDPNEIRSNKLNRLEKKSIAGFTTSIRTRPLIISKLDQYMRDTQVIIRSGRLLDELQTFIWENGKPQAAENYNDDLVMSFCIGLWVRDTALQVHQRGLEYTRLSLDKINKVHTYDAVYTPGNGMSDPYKMPLADGTDEDFRWLL
jgi:hypothetical protein